MSQYEFKKVINLAWIDLKNYWKNNNNKRSIDEANDNVIDIFATRSNKRKKRKGNHASEDSLKMEKWPIEFQDL